MIWELLSPLYLPALASTALRRMVANEHDFPQPVEPTTAMCLLKKRSPSTGTLMSLSWESDENSNDFAGSMRA